MSGIISANNVLYKNIPAMQSTSGNMTNAQWRRIDMFILAQKKCSKCKTVKPLSEFGKHGESIRSSCKICHSADQRARYAKNPEGHRQAQNEHRASNPKHARALAKAWRVSNPDAYREQKKRADEKNPEAMRARKKRWLSKNVDRVKELTRQWSIRNPEKNQEKHHVRRAREFGAGGVITAQEWKDVKKKYNYTCLCCGRREPEIKVTLDHIIPLFTGGKNTVDNAQPLCLSCNSSKGIKTADYREGKHAY